MLFAEFGAQASNVNVDRARAAVVLVPPHARQQGLAREHLAGMRREELQKLVLHVREVEGPAVKVTYTLTSMGCPAGQMIEEDIDRCVRELPGVDEVKPELTFEPPWSPERMSEDAKFILGFG